MNERYGPNPFGFEDLEVYRMARLLRNRVYDLVRLLPAEEKFALAVQMRRAAVSVTNNIAEGYGRFNWQESTHFFHISRASTMELVDDMNVCLDLKYAEPALIQELRQDAVRVTQLLNGYINYLQRSKHEAK